MYWEKQESPKKTKKIFTNGIYLLFNNQETAPPMIKNLKIIDKKEQLFNIFSIFA